MQEAPKLQIDLDALRQIWERAGVATAAIYAGFCDGFKAETRRQKESATSGQESAAETDEIPEDCKHCWCHECATFETCVVPIDGYAPESKPCPCDGCHKGQRYMPKEQPPCKNYRPKKPQKGVHKS